MKKYTIYATGIEGPEAFNMAYALFDDFVVHRGFGISPGGTKVRKHVIVTILIDVSEEATVLQLRDKFSEMSNIDARATIEPITILL